jgi:hypothetical protein
MVLFMKKCGIYFCHINDYQFKSQLKTSKKMKLMRNLCLLTLIITGLASCKKDEATPGITGRWEGKWGFDSETPTHYERWEIKSNGDLIAYDDDGDLYAEGSWTLDGLVFTAEYTSTSDNDYSFSGSYDDQLLEIEGTWGGSPSVTDGGTFEMYK